MGECDVPNMLLWPTKGMFLKPREAARLLGVTDRCLRHWARSGKIAAQRTLGGQYRYPLESIIEILRQRISEQEFVQKAAIYARARRYSQIQKQFRALRQVAQQFGYAIALEEYDLQGGHRIGEGLQRLLLLARERAFRVVMVTSYDRLGWLGAADPRFFHLIFAILGTCLISISDFEECYDPVELVDDFYTIHERLSEHLFRKARRINREILEALDEIRYRHAGELW